MPVSEWWQSPLVQKLGWTIFHSLWQIMALALLFLLFRRLSNRAHARIRYGIGVFVLLLLIPVSVSTFLMVEPENGSPVYNAEFPSISSPIVFPPPSPSPFFLLQNACSRFLPLIVLIWFLGVSFLSLRMLGAWIFLVRIRRQPFYAASRFWKAKLEELCLRIHLYKPVILRESKRIRAPLTLGFLKPVIFFPVGFLAGLPPDQAEALMLHELAHILRRDYLFNFLQSLVEVLFFYHPAVHWISACVREEREYCCDDLAASVTGGTLSMARALVTIHQGRREQPILVLGADGKTHKLFQRIRRLVSMNQRYSSNKGNILGGFLLFLFLGLTLLFLPAIGTGKSMPAAGKYNVLSGQSTAVPQTEKDLKEEIEKRSVAVAGIKSQIGELKEKKKLSKTEEKKLRELNLKLTWEEQELQRLHKLSRLEGSLVPLKEPGELKVLKEREIALKEAAEKEAYLIKEREEQLAEKAKLAEELNAQVEMQKIEEREKREVERVAIEEQSRQREELRLQAEAVRKREIETALRYREEARLVAERQRVEEARAQKIEQEGHLQMLEKMKEEQELQMQMEKKEKEMEVRAALESRVMKEEQAAMEKELQMKSIEAMKASQELKQSQQSIQKMDQRIKQLEKQLARLSAAMEEMKNEKKGSKKQD